MNVTAQNTELVYNGNTKLNIKIYSNDKTKTIILLHGGPGIPDDMIEVVNVLKEKYKIITFDQRGVGLSKCQKCNFTMNDYISDIDTITKKLNIEKFHLFGHSWGGLYAQIYAKERPEKIKSLFLCSPSSGVNKIWKKTEKEVMKFNKKYTSKCEWIRMGLNSLLGMLGSDKAYRKLFKQVLKNYHKDYGDIEVKDNLLDKIHSKPINKTRKEIIKYKPLSKFEPSFPIIVTYGDNDIYGESVKELIERFPTAKVEIINNCGHIPWKHNPAEFNRILKKYYLEKE
jgi:proline iminopeptidase